MGHHRRFFVLRVAASKRKILDMTLQEILNANPRYAVIPPGIYSLDLPLRVLQNQVVMGHGVTLRPSEKFGDSCLISVKGTGWDLESRLNFCGVYGFVLNGNAAVSGIDTDYTTHLKITDVICRNCSAGIIGHNAWDLVITDTFVINATACGVRLSAESRAKPSNYLRLNGVTVERTNGVAINCINQVNLIMSDCKLHGIPGAASQTLLKFTTCDGVRVSNPLFAQAQTAWVKTADCVDVTVVSQITRMK